MKKQFLDDLDELIEIYDELMPDRVCLMKNPDRYPDVMDAVSEIKRIAKACDKGAKIEITHDDLTGTSLCMDIVADLFTVDAIKEFCNALKKADGFEANPRTDGKIQIGVIFEDAWMPVPPTAK